MTRAGFVLLSIENPGSDHDERRCGAKNESSPLPWAPVAARVPHWQQIVYHDLASNRAVVAPSSAAKVRRS